jgi:hypothetical protein
MLEFLTLLVHALGSLFMSKTKLEAENLVLHHQLIVLAPACAQANRSDQFGSRAVCLAVPSLPIDPEAITIVKPETVIRWHWGGFPAYWRWKSRLRISREGPEPKCR